MRHWPATIFLLFSISCSTHSSTQSDEQEPQSWDPHPQDQRCTSSPEVCRTPESFARLDWRFDPWLGELDSFIPAAANTGSDGLGGVEGIWNSTPKPVQAQSRTLALLFEASKDQTGVLMSSRQGSQGWTIRIEPRGQLRLLHELRTPGFQYKAPALSWEPRKLHVLIWHHDERGVQIRLDGQLLHEQQDAPAALDDDAAAPLALGAYPDGKLPFEGKLYFAAQGSALTLDELSALERDLIARQETLRRSRFSVSSPQPHVVFQRQANGLGTIRASGMLNTDPSDEIELKLEDQRDWTKAKRLPDGTWSAQIKAPAGTYTLALRTTKSAQQRALSSINVGDVYLLSGQSNALGSAKTRFTINAPLISKAGLYDGQSPGWVAPYERSWVPRFIQTRIEQDKVPVGVVRFAVGSTHLHKWQPDAPAPRGWPQPLLELLFKTAAQAQGLTPADASATRDGALARAVLWMHGETDAKSGTVDYAARFEPIAHAIEEQLGMPILMSQLQDLDAKGYTTTARLALVRQAQAALIERLPRVLPGPNFNGWVLSPNNGVHFYTDDEVNRCADAWSASVTQMTSSSDN